jgi:hypothetical protein
MNLIQCCSVKQPMPITEAAPGLVPGGELSRVMQCDAPRTAGDKPRLRFRSSARWGGA